MKSRKKNKPNERKELDPSGWPMRNQLYFH